MNNINKTILAISALTTLTAYANNTNSLTTSDFGKEVSKDGINSVSQKVKDSLPSYYQDTNSEIGFEQSLTLTTKRTNATQIGMHDESRCISVSTTQKRCPAPHQQIVITTEESSIGEQKRSTNFEVVNTEEWIVMNKVGSPVATGLVGVPALPNNSSDPSSILYTGTRGDLTLPWRGLSSAIDSTRPKYNGGSTMNFHFYDEAQIRSNLNIYPVYGCGKIGQDMRIVDRNGTQLATATFDPNYGYYADLGRGVAVAMKISNLPTNPATIAGMIAGTIDYGNAQVMGVATTASNAEWNTFYSGSSKIITDPIWSSVCP